MQLPATADGLGGCGEPAAMASLLWLGLVAAVLAAVFELPHHISKAVIVPCRKAGPALEATAGLCVVSPLAAAASQNKALLAALQGEPPELERFPCSELRRDLPCSIPTRREHAGRNCFNRRPKGDALRPGAYSTPRQQFPPQLFQCQGGSLSL